MFDKGGQKIAFRVKEKGSIFAFFPYLSKTRSESVIYFNKEVDITNASIFLKEKKKQGSPVSLFVFIVAAISKTFNERPMLNRFIQGQRIYQRNVFDVSYVIKQTNTDAGEELLATVEIKPDLSPDEISLKMKNAQDDLRNKKDNGLDKLMGFFSKFPRIILRFVFRVIKFLDYYGKVPLFIRKELPFYCSVFVSNLGSIGVDAPFHHLYELGTTSIFLAIGKPELKPVINQKTGEIIVRRMVTLNFTIDERICDGYYLARSLDKFIKYVENPDLLYNK